MGRSPEGELTERQRRTMAASGAAEPRVTRGAAKISNNSRNGRRPFPRVAKNRRLAVEASGGDM